MLEAAFLILEVPLPVLLKALTLVLLVLFVVLALALLFEVGAHWRLLLGLFLGLNFSLVVFFLVFAVELLDLIYHFLDGFLVVFYGVLTLYIEVLDLAVEELVLGVLLLYLWRHLLDVDL